MNLGNETELIEFKESTGELHQAIESVVSILNKHGYGELYFGVKDNGEVKGQIVKDSTIKMVVDGLMRDIEPRITPSVTSISYDDGDVIKITFSGSNKPYSAFGNFLIRVGTTNRKMTREELIKLVQKNNYSDDWESRLSDCSLDDIDDNTLKKYYNEAVNCGRLTLENYDKEQLMTILELIKNGKLTNAAVALFGKKAGVNLKVACFATNDKVTFTDLNLIEGNIYTLINEAVTYISNHINWKVEIDRKRIETPEIPINAIREMVVNAFAHAFYENRPEIEINIHPGMISIFNPGTFPIDVTPEDFINKKISSMKRNPLILDVLYRCKDVEKSGTGFQRMNKLCIESGIRWSYEKSGYGFTFVFDRVTNGSNNVTLNVTLDDLNPSEKEAYSLIKSNPKITREEIAEKISKNIRTVQRITNSLVVKGYILRLGNNRFGYWEILR